MSGVRCSRKKSKQSPAANGSRALLWCSSGDSNPGEDSCLRQPLRAYPLRSKNASRFGVRGSVLPEKQRKARLPTAAGLSFGAPAGIRTPDTLLKRQVLCRLSYWGVLLAGEARRALAGMAGFEPATDGVKGRCLTAWRHPFMWGSSVEKEKTGSGRFSRSRFLWGGIWGSNPRHPEPQSGALPTELIPP